MRRFFFGRPSFVVLWLFAISAICTPVSATPVSTGQHVPFSVFLSGVQIGTYAITAFTEGEQRRLETSTDLHVGFGPITLHRLQQTTDEVWENGKLVRLNAWTDENGGETAVAARVEAGDLVVDGPHGPAVARGSIATLPTLILGETSGQFIDPKNGLLLPIEFKNRNLSEGSRDSKSPDGNIHAFSIRGGINADVWRDQHGVVLMIVQSDGVELEFRRPNSRFVAAGRAAPHEIRVTNLFDSLR